MRLTVLFLSIVGLAAGLSGVVGGSVRVLEGAESAGINGGCFDDSFCNPGNNNCEGWNFFFGNLQNCNGSVETCFFCDEPNTSGGCQGGGMDEKCRYIPSGSVECGVRSDGECDGFNCINVIVTSIECEDMPVCEDKDGTCPW